MNILRPFTREFWVEDEDIRKAVGSLPKQDAVRQAHYSALSVENDREQMRADLMRQRLELKEDLEMVETALDELDALRVLETAT